MRSIASRRMQARESILTKRPGLVVRDASFAMLLTMRVGGQRASLAMTRNERSRPMIQCRRLGYAVLATPDLDRQIRYYTDVLGLFLAHRDNRGAVLSTRQGLECVVLEQQDSIKPGLTGLSFQIDPKVSL